MPRICYVSKRFRAETMGRIRQANQIIGEYQAQGFKLTLRQLYYQFVSRDLLPNTQRAYKQLGDTINDARLAGLVDWEAIEDRTRNMRANAHWSSPSDIVQACAQQFKLDLWDDQDNYCEVWIEKDALVGVIERVCRDLDVPYFACRGYTSQSEMWSAAQRFIAQENYGKNTVIFHLGDHDPSGIDMTRDIQDRMDTFGSLVDVQRIALTMNQIEELGPPPNPAKATDARFETYRREFGDESWELDALEPRFIENLIQTHVGMLIDWERRDARIEEQTNGRTGLNKIARNWQEVVDGLEDKSDEDIEDDDECQ